MPVHYEKGLVDVGNGCFAYLQPDGGWGWSNAGLIESNGVSLLVDTLFDLKLTQEMLDAMADIRARSPIATLVNTHANGDHCYGNQLVKNAAIVASAATAHEMAEVPASMMLSLNDAPGEIGELFRGFFGAFDFSGIEPTPPTETFTGRHDISVGGRIVELHEVGPAHTAGDTIVHVPDAATIFTGDILFSHGTPIVWAGPLSNWIGACDLIEKMAPSVVVPGHGPVSTLADVRDCREYLSMIEREASARHAVGMSASDAAHDIALGEFREWGEWGRIAVNVDTVYRSIDSGYAGMDIFEMFRQMAKLEAAG